MNNRVKYVSKLAKNKLEIFSDKKTFSGKLLVRNDMQLLAQLL